MGRAFCISIKKVSLKKNADRKVSVLLREERLECEDNVRGRQLEYVRNISNLGIY